MRQRKPAGRAALFALAVLAAAAAAGCGSSTPVQGGNDTFSATTLTVYTDLPLLGPDGAAMTSIVNGEELALYDAHGHVGSLHVSIEELNDAASTGVVHVTSNDNLQTAYSAHSASSDLSTVAYIGDLDSAATALSLPLNNENDILQISPGSGYVGFTDPSPVDQRGDPGRYYLNGSRTFARLVPSDAVAAQATVSFMRSLGVRRLDVIADDSAYDSAIAPLIAADASAAGIAIAARQAGIDTLLDAAPAAYAKLAAKVAARHPDAIVLGGSPDAGAQALWRALHAALPQAKLFASGALAASPSFLAGLGAASEATYVTSPLLALGQYPPAAQKVLAEYRVRFPWSAPNAYVLYGYEAMDDVLAAINKAGRYAAQRSSLLSAFHSLGTFHGVIGDYRFEAAGDTSLRSFDGYRVGSGGRLVLVRRIS
jgi:branched-chain amino acid transport system substrate-binding protein